MSLYKIPVSEKEISNLRIGDYVYLSGEIITARDLAHKRIVQYLEKGKELPITLQNSVIYHCGPLVVDNVVYSSGPTTSSRMNEFTPRLLEQGVSIIIGKGGMDSKIVTFMKEHKAVYLTFPGGCGALAAEFVTKIVANHWQDLGMAESIWVFEVNNFGPLIVSIDSEGKTLF